MIFIAGTLSSQEKVAIDFNSDNFKTLQGKVVDFEGRTAFLGRGHIPELSFQNGIIEVDFWMSGERSYPGVNFRVQSPGNYEHFYIRPHRVGLYPDAL